MSYFVTNRGVSSPITQGDVTVCGLDKFTNEFALDSDLRCGEFLTDTIRVFSDRDPQGVPGSKRMFFEIQKRMREEEKPLVIFGHGFNNSFEDALRAADDIEKIYGVVCVVFTWPSDGVLEYRRIKHRAVQTVPAFDRFLEKFAMLMSGVRGVDACGQRVSLLAHSMFNFIIETYVKSPFFQNEFMLFDNVNLFAADVNNEGHGAWLDQLKCRRDVNVWINVNDVALDISDSKYGALQLPRLGNYLKGLNGVLAHYYNVTDAPGVGRGHGYFKDPEVAGVVSQAGVAMSLALRGSRVKGMSYHQGLNLYSPPLTA